MIPEAAVICSVFIILLCLLLLMSEGAELVLLLRGAATARRYRSTGFAGDALLKSPMAPGVTVVAVPPDASDPARLQIRSLLKMRSASATVVVVLDGPTNTERSLWISDFRLEPATTVSAPEGVRCVYRSRDPIALTVVDRQKGTLPACLNTAVSLTDAPVVAVVDQSAEVSEEALLVALESFLSGPERTVALSVTGPASAGRGFSALLYRAGFLRCWLERSSLAQWHSAPPLPGSLTLFDRETVTRLGGFHGDALEMVLRIHKVLRAAKSSDRIVFVPLAVARPRMPQTWEQSRSARKRLRVEERRAIPVSGLVYHYFRPFASIALMLLAAAALGLGWMQLDFLLLLLGVTFAARMLTTMTTILLGEYAAPAAGCAGDLAGLFLATFCCWMN
jgi:hypothetical protein